MTSTMGTHAETMFASTADHASMVELKTNVDELPDQARETARAAGHLFWAVSSVSHEVTPLDVLSKKTTLLGLSQQMTTRFVASALVVVSWETGLSAFE